MIFQQGGSRFPVSDGVRQLLGTFSIAAYPGVGGYTQFGRCIYDRQIGGQFKTSVSQNYGFN